MELYMYSTKSDLQLSVVGFAAVRRLSRRQALGVLCARCCVELHARGRLAALPARPR